MAELAAFYAGMSALTGIFALGKMLKPRSPGEWLGWFLIVALWPAFLIWVVVRGK